jgi:hypothetical protein
MTTPKLTTKPDDSPAEEPNNILSDKIMAIYGVANVVDDQDNTRMKSRIKIRCQTVVNPDDNLFHFS